MIMPFGTYITPKRFTGLAAVPASAESAGTMLSRNGSASVAPMPRRTVRRGIAFLEMNIHRSLFFRHAQRLAALSGAHAERRAADDAADDGRRPIVTLRGFPRNFPDRRLIVVFEAAANRVRQQLCGKRADEILLVTRQERSEPVHTFESCAIRQRRGCVNSLAVADRAPLSVGVEILERKSDGIHSLMARCAYGILPMHLHPVAKRPRGAVHAGVFQRWHVGRRRR